MGPGNAGSPQSIQASPAEDQAAFREQVASLHQRAIVVDTHADTTQRIVYQGARFLDGIPGAHLDLPKMRAGGLDAQFFSIFVAPRRTPAGRVFLGIAPPGAGNSGDGRERARGQLALARTAAESDKMPRVVWPPSCSAWREAIRWGWGRNQSSSHTCGVSPVKAFAT